MNFDDVEVDQRALVLSPCRKVVGGRALETFALETEKRWQGNRSRKDNAPSAMKPDMRLSPTRILEVVIISSAPLRRYTER